MFLETGAISEEDFSRAEKKAKQEKITLAEAIVRLEILSEEEVARILADVLGFPLYQTFEIRHSAGYISVHSGNSGQKKPHRGV